MTTNPPLVLFAEAGQRWARLLGSKLARSGIEVRFASSVTKILRFLETSIPDLIVLDQEVVGNKVDTFVELLRRRAGASRVILLSSPGTGGGAVPPEVWGHLWKPVDLGLVLSAVESALGECLDGFPDSGGHILCVDDDPLFLRSLERILTRYDYRVSCFRRPECVADALPALRPDLVIVDLQMPVLDGRRLARTIRDYDPHGLPILFLSASSPDPDAGQERGTAFLSKPAEPEAVLAAIERLLAQGAADPSPVLVRG